MPTPALITFKTHEPHLEIDSAVWASLGIKPGEDYRWSVSALRQGRALDTRSGVIRFISDDEDRAVSAEEAAIREMPAQRRLLGLAGLYSSASLFWEACDVLGQYLRRNPQVAVAHLLLARVCEDMERVQEAARAIGQANRVLAAT
ncbi:MAG: hypothetical protein FJX76_25875 [Armatimonadetes bacterium]|nr:hypothetical protein [Armatimonadota bacterium]